MVPKNSQGPFLSCCFRRWVFSSQSTRSSNATSPMVVAIRDPWERERGGGVESWEVAHQELEAVHK